MDILAAALDPTVVTAMPSSERIPASSRGKAVNTFDAADLSADALGAPHLRTFGRHFIDGYGRIIQPRGVNVSGASKLPVHQSESQNQPQDFFDQRAVTFVGRPFPLDEAPFHFTRLRAWGHTLVRLLVTWEALAHDGPADLDQQYMCYLEQLILLMDKHGIKVIICAHQDVWSRFSGGSGAPGWTFEKAGLDIEAFKATGAAYVHNVDGAEQESSKSTPLKTKEKEPVGPFVWPSGYQKLAAATMATLFWGGDIFAWQLQIPHYDAKKRSEGQSLGIQQYLQETYMEAFGTLVDRVGHIPAVLGVDVMNEPHRGYIGLHGWHKWCYETDLHIGHFPSALQSFALGSGHRQEVPFYVKSWPWPTRCSHKSIIDPLGKTAWLNDCGMKQCIWRAHGVWQWDESAEQPVVLVDDFFTRDPRPGRKKTRIEWYRDCYAPFIDRFVQRMRRQHTHLLCFLEPIPNEFMPPWTSAQNASNLQEDERMTLMKASYDQNYATQTFIDTTRPENIVYAPHFYDLNVLFGKTYKQMSVNVQTLSRGQILFKALYFGIEGLCKNYAEQIRCIVEYGKTSLGSVPTVIGEVGIPYDINEANALRTGDYRKHIELYDALIKAMEASQVAFTLWNYNPDNTISQGDGWNKEDFSIVCNEEQALDTYNDMWDRGAAYGMHRNFRKGLNDWSPEDLHRGGRALTAIIRPYASKVAGYPLEFSWDREKQFFEFKYANPPPELRQAALRGSTSVEIQISRGANQQPSASKKSLQGKGVGTADATDRALASEEARTSYIYIPRYHFDGCDVRVQVMDGTFTYDRERQTLAVCHLDDTPGFVHVVRVTGSRPKSIEDLAPETQRLVHRRAANARQRRGRTSLTAQDICAILGVFACFGFALALAYGASVFMETMS